MIDETLDFGDLWMPTGRAFSTSMDDVRPLGQQAQVRLPDLSDPAEIPILKRWMRTRDGVFMVESAAYQDVAARLVRVAGVPAIRKSGGGVVLNEQTPPKPSVGAGRQASPKLAAVPFRSNGVVMDVVPLVGSSSSFTFTNGVTYHISGGFGVGPGTATFQSGCVIKSSPGAYFYVYGYLNFPSSSGSTPLFTSKDDDLYGESVSGSTGNPAYAAAQALWVYYPTSLTEVKNARFRWAGRGVQYDMNPGLYLSHVLKESYFENCSTGLVVNLQQSNLTLTNVKKTNVSTEKVGSGTVYGSMTSYSPGASLNSSFAGLTRNDAATQNKAPADTQIAVGTSHIVTVAGGGVAVYNKSGQKLADATLESFLTVTADGTTYPQAAAGDGRVIYDPNWSGGRFIVCAHDAITGGNILLAVSNSSDPYGGGGSGWIESNWKKYVLTNGVPNVKPEFPTLGVDSTGIYCWSQRLYAPYAIVAVKKSVIDGASPPKKLGVILEQTPGIQFVHPVQNFDSAAPGGYAWFMAEDVSNSRILYGRLKWMGDSPYLEGGSSWLSVSIPSYASSSSGSFPQSCNLSVSPSLATSHALPVLRNGYLWFCHDLKVNANGTPQIGGDRAAIQWFRFQFATNSGVVSLANPISGRIFDGAASNPWHYYDGSIAVNSLGHMVVGFSGSKTGTHIGAFYAARLNHGYLVAPTSFKSGVDCYYPQTPGNPARWGDYSATCVDPADDTKFWTAQEYAETQTGSTFPQNARWGTFIGKISPN